MPYTYPKSIAEAVEILDSHKPEWRQSIRVDELDLENTEYCILGQLFGSYEDGMEELFDLSPFGRNHGDDYQFDDIFGYRASKRRWEEHITNPQYSLSTVIETLERAAYQLSKVDTNDNIDLLTNLQADIVRNIKALQQWQESSNNSQNAG